MQEEPLSTEVVIARAQRFLHDLASGEIEELADYLADCGFSDTGKACAAIRTSLLKVIADLRAEHEIEKAIPLEALLGEFDAAWTRW